MEEGERDSSGGRPSLSESTQDNTAAFLSPRVARPRSCDNTFRKCLIDRRNPSHDFSRLMSLSRCERISVNSNAFGFSRELSTEVENDKLFDCLKVSAAAEFTVPRWRRAPCGFGVKQAEYFLFALRECFRTTIARCEEMNQISYGRLTSQPRPLDTR